MDTKELYDYLISQWQLKQKLLKLAVSEGRDLDAQIISAKMSTLTDIAVKIMPIEVYQAPTREEV